jgi:SAM-dependent methyltransferase
MEVESESYVCREHDLPLERSGDLLTCAKCGPTGRIVDGVHSFLSQADDFYEGRYSARTKFIPRGTGFLSMAPFHVVHQGYPANVAAHIAPGSTVLDIGSAGGFDWFAQRYRMIGIDLSLSSLRELASRYSVAVQGTALHMPLAPETVDGVISSCVFEHFTSDDKRLLLSECRRVLRPGGKIVFFYDVETDNPVIRAFKRKSPEDYRARFLEGDGHVGYESVEANRRHFTDAGFEIIKETFHERTFLLSNSVWQKFAQWPGAFGIVGGIGRLATSGPLRLPSLAAIAIADATIGRVLPQRYARCMMSIAVKR